MAPEQPKQVSPDEPLSPASRLLQKGHLVAGDR